MDRFRHWIWLCALSMIMLVGCHRKTEEPETDPGVGAAPQPGATGRADRSGMAAEAVADAPDGAAPIPLPLPGTDPALADSPEPESPVTDTGEPASPTSEPVPVHESTPAVPAGDRPASGGGEGFALKAGPFDGRARFIDLDTKSLSAWGVPAFEGAKGMEPLDQELPDLGSDPVFMLADAKDDKVATYYEQKLEGWGDFKKQLIAMAQLMMAQQQQQQQKQGGETADLPDPKEYIEAMLPGRWRVSPDQKTVVGVIGANNAAKTVIIAMHREEGMLSGLMPGGPGGPPPIPGKAPGGQR